MKSMASERPKKAKKKVEEIRKEKGLSISMYSSFKIFTQMLLCEHTSSKQHFEKNSFSMSQKAWILFAGIMARRMHPWLLIAVSLEKQE